MTSFYMFDEKILTNKPNDVDLSEYLNKNVLFRAKNRISSIKILRSFDLMKYFYHLEIRNVPNQVPNRLVVLNKIALHYKNLE